MKNIVNARLSLAASGVLLVIASVLFYQAYFSGAVPSQDRVASTQSLGQVETNDPALSKALDARDLSGLRAQLGRPIAFQGTVTTVFSPPGGKVTILNFAPNFHDAALAIIRSEDYSKFPDVRALSGKRVLVSGVADEHTSKEGASTLEVRLNEAQQLRIVP